MHNPFIGRGFAFPMRTDAAGGIAMVSDERELVESMRLILGTAYGERPMRPEFGCGIHDRVFDSANPLTAGLIEADVRASLTRWEPRVAVQGVVVTFDIINPGCCYIDITYTVAGSNDPRNLVFPFYTIPAEE